MKSKILGHIFGKMTDICKIILIGKILALSSDETVCGESFW